MQFNRQRIEVEAWPPAVAALRLEAFEYMDLPDPGEAVWLVTAESGGLTVGYAYADRGIESETSSVLCEVAVAANQRGRGIGTRLVAHVVDWMADDGFETMVAMPLVGDGYERRVAWLEALGFREPPDRETTHCARLAELAPSLRHLIA